MSSWINWFEVPVADLVRAKTFYESVFQIKMTDQVLANGLKMAIFPGTPGTISGALCYHPEFYKPSTDGPLIYLNANPLMQEILDRIEASGGKILVPMTKISDEAGSMSVFLDSEGNRIALHSQE